MSKRRARKIPSAAELSAPDTLIPASPTIGVVIGTYGSAPYIALQLESRRRYWPDVPVLIHDDSSDDSVALKAVCESYGATFVTTSQRMAATVGDMNAFVTGLEWAERSNIDLLVKFSRRFVACKPWIDGLRELAVNSQYATFSNFCADFDFSFRSECVALHVPSWLHHPVADEMRGYISRNERSAEFPERWYHEKAREVHASVAPRILRQAERFFPRDPQWDGYGIWPLMGLGRKHRADRVLWHDSHSPEDYYRLAVSWGLSQYSLADFQEIVIEKPGANIR